MTSPKQIAIVVTSYFPKWYKGKLRSIKHTDKVRGDIALEFIKKCKNKGYATIVAEAHSSKSYRKELRSITGVYIKFRRSHKRGPGKRDGYKIASKIPEVKVILTTEPEKLSLIECIPQIVKPILEEKADIVIPQREDALFKTTYPRYQYESEVDGNNLYNEFLLQNKISSKKDADLDWFFGPRAFSNKPKILHLFTKKYLLAIPIASAFDPEEYSNTLYFPVVEALRKKLNVAGVKVPFSYHKLQKENEEVLANDSFAEKRRLQKLSLMLDLAYFLKR